jgi:putative membrane protein
MSAPAVDEARYRKGMRLIYVLSAVVCAVVLLLMSGSLPEGVRGAVDVSGLPAVNASINASTMVLLIAGGVAIKLKRIALHRALMLTAFGASTLFLCTYVVYHLFSPGPTRYQGDYRGVYIVILLSHVLLSVVILPLAMGTLFRGLMGAIARHRAWAPITLGIWLYVSVTGVLVYWMAHG